MTQRNFAHHRLDAYHAALALAVSAKPIAARVPRGYRAVADQLIRSATAVPLLVAEGANRRSSAQKRQRFGEAHGECGDAAAAVEVLAAMALAEVDETNAFLDRADRVAAMLAGLIRRHR